MRDGVVLGLVGDVMTGRGIDQVLPSPGDPRLWERYVGDATAYVRLAEAVSGRIVRPVAVDWPWGAALDVLDAERPDLLVVNVETSITTCDEPAPGKRIHYRMHPANVGCLTVARPDACVLANNHVLDFGPSGLAETLETLAATGLPVAGAGPDGDHAWRPVELWAGERRVLLWAVATACAGVPSSWAAGPGTPGVAFLHDLSADAADALGARVRRDKRPGDVAVVSVHWGGNWGYGVSRQQVRFAHALVDAGVDVVHGHSSHHPRPIEVYHDRLVLYGCGDFVNDYEGIGGYEQFRDDLRLLYLPALEPDGRLRDLRMVPFRARRLRLERAPATDAAWLARTLTHVSRRFGTRVLPAPDGPPMLRVEIEQIRRGCRREAGG